MKAQVLARTMEVDNLIIMSKEEHEEMHRKNKILGGKFGGICYGGDNYTSEAIQNEGAALTRANNAAKSGHHSIFDHTSLTILLEGHSKMLAMVLNSLGVYTTSERSARYTKMSAKGLELEKYNFWIDKLSAKIEEVYPEIEETSSVKLATENARYMLSVFTPTTMAYTVSDRQLSYSRQWFKEIVDKYNNTRALENKFNTRLINELEDFIVVTEGLVEDGFITDTKHRKIDFLEYLSNSTVYEYDTVISDVYQLNYTATFAEVAQAIRHRTLGYIMQFDGNMTNKTRDDFFVPPIIAGDGDLREQWLDDIMQLADNIPQGTLINMVEQGLTRDFFLKCKERLCGAAQLEIALVEAYKLKNLFIPNKENLSKQNQSNLDEITGEHGEVVTRCKFKSFTCSKPCRWGSVRGLNRLI